MVESAERMVSSVVFALASEASVIKSDVMVETGVKRVVELAPGFMEVTTLEAADSWDVDSTEGVTETTIDAGVAVVEAAPISELVVGVTWTVVGAIGDRVLGVLVASFNSLVTVVGPLVVMFLIPVGLFGGFGL